MTTSPLTFVRESYDELKKVKWPTRDDIIRLTIAVVAISLLVGVLLGSIDLFLTKLTDFLLNR
ncbi:MAG: preprotein translocase subunit SecE [Candidatus Levybacteria bacterium RIFCSPLOWO2_01_FULL_39_10]|nr:MAG: preprotein translocase subunit SecE [Candidatus Levybacteria bacterium RIFCSPLOWO2_01_FULL_39_10]